MLLEKNNHVCNRHQILSDCIDVAICLEYVLTNTLLELENKSGFSGLKIYIIFFLYSPLFLLKAVARLSFSILVHVHDLIYASLLLNPPFQLCY